MTSRDTPEEQPAGAECVYCGGDEDLNPELGRADGGTDWVCDECREKGRGLK